MDGKKIIETLQDKALEEQFDQIRELVTSLRSRTEKAEKQVEEWNIDDEIQKLNATIKKLYEQLSWGFNPSTEQWTEIRAWENKHREKHHKKDKKESGKMPLNPAAFSYRFGHTHLGTLGTVICETCMERAMSMSRGDIKEFERIKKELEAEMFVGEI